MNLSGFLGPTGHLLFNSFMPLFFISFFIFAFARSIFYRMELANPQAIGAEDEDESQTDLTAAGANRKNPNSPNATQVPHNKFVEMELSEL